MVCNFPIFVRANLPVKVENLFFIVYILPLIAMTLSFWQRRHFTPKISTTIKKNILQRNFWIIVYAVNDEHDTTQAKWTKWNASTTNVQTKLSAIGITATTIYQVRLSQSPPTAWLRGQSATWWCCTGTQWHLGASAVSASASWDSYEHC